MNTRRRADPIRHRGGDNSNIKRLRILHSSTSSIIRGVQASSSVAATVLLYFILLVFTSKQQPTTALRFFNLGKNKQKSVASNSTIMVTDDTTLTVLVVGATGATGKHVVQQLLDKGHKVKTIVRSQERMMAALKKDDNNDYTDRLFIKQASLLDMTDEELAEQVSNVDAVVSCLGHTLDFQGMYGYQSRNLVLNTTRRLTMALLQKEINGDKNTSISYISKTKKRFILMNTEGVVNPAGTDDIRPFSERVLLAVIRFLVPPHRDNEAAAQYVYDNLPSNSSSSGSSSQQQQLEWVVIRPTDLINENKDGSVNDKYRLTSKPIGSLFGAGIATRSNVARSMVDLLTNNSLWDDYKFQMPCVYDAEPYCTAATSSSEEINKKEQEL